MTSTAHEDQFLPHPDDVAQAPAEGAGDDWRIDHSAGRPILVYQNCSVIEAEQAEYVLRLIEADRQQRGGDGLHNLVAEKFSSGNAIPVERITITRTEWDATLAATKGESNG